MTSSTFDAWEVPGWAPPPSGTTEARGAETTPVVRYPTPAADWVRTLVAGLAARGPSGPDGSGGLLRPGGADERAEALGAVGARFLDADDSLRTEALALLPATSGLSPAMARAVLDGMARDWIAPRLRRLMREELGGPESLAGFVQREGRWAMAVPPRLCTQLVAGSVPGVGATALVRSLLLGAPTLLKPGLGDVLLPVLFARGLRDVAPELADALAVVYWPGGDEALEREALRRAEVAVAYGSDASVASLRGRAPATTRFVGYHHREGIGVVGAADLGDEATADGVASEVARAVALFDQRGCVSTRILWVEDVGTPVSPSAFADLLADALAQVEGTLPSGELEPLERSALQQLRGTAEILASGWDPGAEDRPTVRHGSRAPWTVVYDPYRAVETSCVGRVVVVRPFRTVEELVERVRPLAPHLQTVGVSGLDDRLEAIARTLGRLGVSRVVPFQAVPFPPPWWHHDGRGPLTDLVRWVDLEVDG